jgi:hypothetical protein
MLIAQSTIKHLHSSFPHTCWVRQVLTLAINNVAQKEEAAMKMLLELGIRNPSRLPVMFGAFISRIKCKSLIIFLFLTWHSFCIHLYVTMCMKLDPGMHIVTHLVFFGETGVTFTVRVVYFLDSRMTSTFHTVWSNTCKSFTTLSWSAYSDIGPHVIHNHREPLE